MTKILLVQGANLTFLGRRDLLAVRRGPYQQYCQTRHPLRPLGRGRGLHHWLWDALLHSRSRSDAGDIAIAAPRKRGALTQARELLAPVYGWFNEAWKPAI